MNRKRLLYIILFVVIFIVTFCYTYFISFLNLDEVWNYGFSYNIASGLIPYKDFNMLQNPLLLFIGSVFVRTFGNHLWSVHIFTALLVSSMMVVIYNKIGKKAFIMYPIILLYCVYSYNILCLFWGIIIVNLLDSNSKYSEYLLAFIVSLVFLTKQNIGICLFIPMMFYSKNKFKSFFIFLIPNLVLLIYLICHDCVYSYINYAFLGMLDFGKNNGSYSFIVFYLILVFYLLYSFVKSHFRNKHLFYILMFQIVGFPIIDDYHFMIGFLLYLYYLLYINKSIDKYFKYVMLISVSFFVIYLVEGQEKLDEYDLSKLYLNNDKESFLYGRNFYVVSQRVLDELSNCIISNKKYYGDNIFVLANWGYLVKLNIGDNPGKYDFILDGNMGYRGDEVIINDFKRMCSKVDCLFIVALGGNQLNYNIVHYVVNNYFEVDKIKDVERHVSGSNRLKHSYYYVYSSRKDRYIK